MSPRETKEQALARLGAEFEREVGPKARKMVALLDELHEAVFAVPGESPREKFTHEEEEAS